MARRGMSVAMAIVGDPAATDPVCIKSPHRDALTAQADAHAAASADLVYRTAPGKPVPEPAD